MTRKSSILPVLLSSGILLAANGCSLITAHSVGTAVATHVGKKVIKDMKEDHDQKKAEEEKQTAQGEKRPD